MMIGIFDFVIIMPSIHALILPVLVFGDLFDLIETALAFGAKSIESIIQTDFI